MLDSRNDADFLRNSQLNFKLLQTSSDGLTPFSFPLSLSLNFWTLFERFSTSSEPVHQPVGKYRF